MNVTLQKVKVPILPDRVLFGKRNRVRALDREAICVFAATGFFLERDTYWIDEMALQPGYAYSLDEAGYVLTEKKYWDWHYTPRDISLKQATEEFAHLFERLVREAVGNKRVILPLSGGLDSRTLAAALRDRPEQVQAFSYEFEQGHPETSYGQAIARALGFDFQKLVVPRGYLWQVIDRLAVLNGCHAEFTHPRQMAFVDRFRDMGELFLLGHWGDVLFDDMGVPDGLDFEAQRQVVLKKMVKKGGLELAEALWRTWGLEGHFRDYLEERISDLLRTLDIDNANARIRAFKSRYWAYRWTTVNLSVFASVHPIALPYYHDEMCRFVCTVPERWLAGRQIQIEYLKLVAPQLAKITWQAHRPFNLYNYTWNRVPWNLPYRLLDKSRRTIQSLLGKPLVQRNWELQFVGAENDRHLRKHLIDADSFVPKALREEFYRKFKEEDAVKYSHPVSMLLTLNLFNKLENND